MSTSARTSTADAGRAARARPRPRPLRLAGPQLAGRPLDSGRPRRGTRAPSPYALRHTYASFSIAAGVSLFELARFMGTSVDQIDKTYEHLLPDPLDRTRTALDTFVHDAADEAFGH